MNNKIYIYDEKFDDSINFLNRLVESSNSSIYNRNYSSSNIIRAIKSSDTVYLLGHGTEYGLLSRRSSEKSFDRFLIEGKHVQFLREKECIGIWCNANIFAEKYNLHGLFSGMIISEIEESIEYITGYTPTVEEITNTNNQFIEALKYCLDNYSLKDIPDKMKEMIPDDNPINLYNFKSLYYYEQNQI